MKKDKKGAKRGLHGENRWSLKIARQSLKMLLRCDQSQNCLAIPQTLPRLEGTIFELKHDYSARNVPPQVALDHQLCPFRMKAVGSLC